MCNLFISYASQDEGIVDSLRDYLKDRRVQVWMYSYDKTIGDDAWVEIKSRIQCCRVLLFVASNHTLNAEGQHRELKIAFDRLKEISSQCKIVPLLVGGVDFQSLPKEIRYVNGFSSDSNSNKVIAFEITKQFFPELLPPASPNDWHFPKPGEWLKVCNLDSYVAEYFNVDDNVYFRRISPIGLFECYAPKIKELYWFLPSNLSESKKIDEHGTYTLENVPPRYKISSMLDIERLGLTVYNKRSSKSQEN